MALLKLKNNICGFNQQTYVYLSANPATWDDCCCRQIATFTSPTARGASTGSNSMQSKQTNGDEVDSKTSENRTNYQRLKSKIKSTSKKLNVPLKIAEMNKYLSSAFVRNQAKSGFNMSGIDSSSSDMSDVPAYSLEKTVTKINQSIFSYYDSTYVDENLQAAKPSEMMAMTKTRPGYLEDDFANSSSPSPLFPVYTPTPEDKEIKARERRAEKISRLSLETRTKSLIQGLQTAISLMSRLTRLEELCQHLTDHPECVWEASNEKILPVVLKLAESPDKNVKGMANQCLSLLGYAKPLQSPGIRILAIDGGGTRGVVALEFLKALEKATGKRSYELFDYVCGVSTGALLTVMLCMYQLPLPKIEEIYKKSSIKTFTRNKVVGTTRLVWNHGFYDSKIWENLLKKEMGSTPFIEFSKDPNVPRMSAVSAKVSSRGMMNHLFRNYNLPPGKTSQYPGHCKHKVWEVIRASSAAPGYFEPFKLGSDIHEDGGILTNNPTALAIHESRLLWEKENLHCILSLGTGRSEVKSTIPKLSLKRKISTIVDSACDTEGVHHTLQDLLPSNSYFRFNPYLSEDFFLDEIRPDKIEQMQHDARMYNRRNSQKLMAVAKKLTENRTPRQRVGDWMKNMVQNV